MKFRRPPVSSDRRFRKSHRFQDFGNPQRWQHSGRVFERADQTGLLVSRACEESVLDVLHLAGKISARQKAAGLRLRCDFLQADLAARLVASYNVARVSGFHHCAGDYRTDRQEEAYERWRRALVAVGMMFSDTLVTVACHDITPDERHLLVLQMGLIKLAKWYGIPSLCLDDDVDQTAARQVAVRCDGGASDGAGESRTLH